MTENVAFETASPSKAKPATENVDWASLSGSTLDAVCELKEVVEVRDGAARFRVRILGSGGRQGTGYFLRLPAKEAEDQLDIWRTLREIQHPNLNRPLSVGRRQVGDAETVYMVLAEADEKLSAVVPERPLEWEEAAEVLQSLERGLAHLHACGLIHGSVSPETVQAVGYTIQLDTGSVRRLGSKPRIEWSKPQYIAPESKGVNSTKAADVWCLGATLFELITQEKYGTAGAELEKGLPIGGVIARCLEKNPATRCTLKEGPAFEAVPAAAREEPVKAETPKAEPAKSELLATAKLEANGASPQPAPHVEAISPAPAVKTEIKAPELKIANPKVTDSGADSTPGAKRPADNRVPGIGTVGTRPVAAPRVPHPLMPKPTAARQVTKDDMALVPVGKRHRKVQGKRQPISARIRTLDEPLNEGYDETAAREPGVVARVLAVGKKANFVRAFIAGSLLASLVIAAFAFIIIPKFQSVNDPIANLAVGQPQIPSSLPSANGDGAAASADASLPAGAAAVLHPGSVAPNDVTGKNSDAAAAGLISSVPSVPVKRERFHVVLATFASRTEAAQRLDKIAQQHPDLFLQLITSATNAGERRYSVVVGGMLSHNEADQLRTRIQNKGLQDVQIVPAVFR